MASAFEIFASNPKSEADGVWNDFGDFKIRIARAGGANKRFVRVMEAKTKPYLRAIKTETLDPDIANRIFMECYAQCVITGWECNTAKQGEEAKWEPVVEVEPGIYEAFSDAAVLKALVALPNLFEDIKNQAGGFASFKDEVRAVNAGNSRKS